MDRQQSYVCKICHLGRKTMINSADATSWEWGLTSNGESIGGGRILQPSTAMKPPFEGKKMAYHGLKTINLGGNDKEPTNHCLADPKSVNEDKNAPPPPTQAHPQERLPPRLAIKRKTPKGYTRYLELVETFQDPEVTNPWNMVHPIKRTKMPT